MISLFTHTLLVFFTLALVAVTIQNSVFARALNVSRMLSLMDDTTNTVIFGILLCAVNIRSGVLNYLLNRFWFNGFPFSAYLRPLAMIVCMAVSFWIVFFAVVQFAPNKYYSPSLEALPAATFNCTVIGTLLIATTSQFSLLNTVAFGLGSGVGFVLATLMVTVGQHKFRTGNVPNAFKGLPVTLLYLAGLALAVYGLSGHRFAF